MRGDIPIVIEQAKKIGLKVTVIQAEQVEQIAPTEQVEIETAPTEQVEPEPKPSQPKRKPFTPY
ncbi:hypothetical protein P9Z72_11925, partial [Glaesserella parasuis]|nr:hypothetical protein [Glaesserella parasuis]